MDEKRRELPVRILMHQPMRPHAQTEFSEPDFRLLDVATVMVRSWKLIALVLLGTLAVAILIAAVQRRSYTTEVAMVPSVEQSSRTGLLPGGLELPLLGRVGSGQNPHQTLIEAVLRSQSLRDTVQDRIAPDLDSRRGREVADVLRDHVVIRTGSADRSVRVQITSHDADLAVDIANMFPVAINDIAAGIALETALRKRETLERQLDDARRRLAASEDAVLAFEQRSGAPAVEEQARRTMETAAELQREIFAQEVRVAQLRRSATPDNPQLRAAEAELEGWRAQLRRLTSGRSRADLFLTQEELPDMKLEYQRLVREMMKDEQIYVAVTAALAAAEADAREELAVVSVLDTAQRPTSPSSPRWKLVLAVGTLLGLALGMMLALVREYFRKSRADGSSDDFLNALNAARSDAARLLPFRGAGRSNAAL